MAEEKECDPSAPKPIPLPSQSSRQPTLNSPTSPATDDLGMKIAAVKNVWESMPRIFESMTSTSGPIGDTTEANDSITSSGNQVTFSGFGAVDTPHDMSVPDPNVVDHSMVLRSSASDIVTESDLARALAHSQGQLAYSDADVNVPNGQSVANNMAMTKSIIEQSNVCKVKPQQLHQASSNSPTMAVGGFPGMTGIPSPQSQVILTPTAQPASQYHPFPVGSSQLIDSRYNQPSYGFSLSQQPQTPAQAPIAPAAFSQASLFLQPTPAAPSQNDLYQQGANQMQGYRNQFGQSQQNTIMVSSTSSSLMSATIKPPNHNQNQYLSGASQKSNPLPTLQYSQLMGNTSLQPSQMFVQFDPQANQTAAPAAPSGNQNVNSSQIIGSQLMQQRQPVQNVQTVQGQSSFYSQQPLQQTGFYQAQQNASTLTGPIQQVTAPTQYNMQGFGAQPQGLNLPIQTVTLTGQSQLNKSAPPFKPAAQQLSVSSPATSQVTQVILHSFITLYCR